MSKSIKIKVIGVGRNTISLIEQTEKIVKKEDYDQVWCVFDHDPKPDIPIQSQNFNNAIQKAKSLGYKVAYSNQAFEYWLILHFKDEQGTPMSRAHYYDEINKYINLSDDKYENNKKISKEMFIRLQEIDENTQKTRQNLAIQRAKRIMKYWEEIDIEHSNPAKEESSTTVYQLVEELLSYARTK
ncbi:MAG: RloB domain-containing protein [Cytophagia bacterium]|nr:MAG: RloB domain-containing protein [Cytophagia bacterium]TAG37869.1 MAG: RloB domain-containing protein [Cytophagia bacterium]